jgi:hypothetical protein
VQRANGFPILPQVLVTLNRTLDCLVKEDFRQAVRLEMLLASRIINKPKHRMPDKLMSDCGALAKCRGNLESRKVARSNPSKQ